MGEGRQKEENTKNVKNMGSVVNGRSDSVTNMSIVRLLLSQRGESALCAPINFVEDKRVNPLRLRHTH